MRSARTSTSPTPASGSTGRLPRRCPCRSSSSSTSSCSPSPRSPPWPTTPAPAATLPLPDGPTVLLQSLDALAPGYHFVITATLNGDVALATEGDQIGLSSRRTVTSQGVAVDYVVLTAGSFDLLVEIVCEDDEKLLDILNEQIRSLDGVISTETFVYLKLRKQLYNWGTR